MLFVEWALMLGVLPIPVSYLESELRSCGTGTGSGIYLQREI